MQRDTLDRFIALVQKTYSGCVLWHEIIEIIIADELESVKIRRRLYKDDAIKLLQEEINELNPNNPRRLAWDIMDIYTGALVKLDEARANKAKAKTESEDEDEDEEKVE